MMQASYKTNLRCGACVESIGPLFDQNPSVKQWSVDVSADGKPLTLESTLSRDEVDRLLQSKGYRIVDAPTISLGMASESKPADTKQPFDIKRYWPLILIALYLVGTVICFELVNWPFVSWMRAMAHFMAGFFLVFSFFKLLNLRAFADSYRMYDVIAKEWSPWGVIYPFVELGLGIAYLVAGHWKIVNIVTLILMLLGTLGVAFSLMKKKTIQCACLGTVFNLPMSWVTLVEDLLMAAMAGVMLVV